MDIAARMFQPVWKMIGGSKLLWYARYEAVREAEIKRNNKIKKDMEAKRSR